MYIYMYAIAKHDHLAVFLAGLDDPVGGEQKFPRDLKPFVVIQHSATTAAAPCAPPKADERQRQHQKQAKRKRAVGGPDPRRPDFEARAVMRRVEIGKIELFTPYTIPV